MNLLTTKVVKISQGQAALSAGLAVLASRLQDATIPPSPASYGYDILNGLKDRGLISELTEDPSGTCIFDVLP